jgi:ABC-2 type transport system permease protein
MNLIDLKVLLALSRRTFRHSFESPVMYVVAVFFYGFVGGIFGLNFFLNGQASVDGLSMISPWILWFVIPALTMGLISEELRSGTFEQLATLPLGEWEIVLGKYLGFALVALTLIGGLLFYPVLAFFVSQKNIGIDWGAALGGLAGLYLLSLTYGAMGLFASSLAKNQVVALILGMVFCTVFFFVGQFYTFFPGVLSNAADFMGVVSHLTTLSRGVWDLRDFVYFISVSLMFLYFTVQRLITRRF